MATFSVSEFTQNVPARAGNGVQAVVRRFTIPTGFATNDFVNIARIPAGAMLLDAWMASNAAVGATGTLSLGDAADDNRIIASVAYTSAVHSRVIVPATAAIGYTYAAETTVQIKAESIATPTVGTIVTVTLLYSMYQY